MWYEQRIGGIFDQTEVVLGCAVLVLVTGCALAPAAVAIQKSTPTVSHNARLENAPLENAPPENAGQAGQAPQLGQTGPAVQAPTPLPTITILSPTVAPSPRVNLIDACGTSDSPGAIFAQSERAVIHLAAGGSRPYCIIPAQNDIPNNFPGLALLGSLPDPKLLLDESGQPLEYLGVANYSFAWLKSDGSRLELQAIFPAWIGDKKRTIGTQVAPVLVWKGGADQRFISGWQLQLVGRNDGKPLVTVEHPFIGASNGQTFQLKAGTNFEFGRDTRTDFLPAHYELTAARSNSADPAAAQWAGVPIYFYTNFQPRDALQTFHGYLHLNDQQFSLRTFSLYGTEVGFLGEMPLNSFVDEKGRAVIPMGIQGFTYTWRDEDNNWIVLPIVYPGIVNGAAVAPILLCDRCANPRVLTRWQVWLVDLATSKPVQVIEHPFAQLDEAETTVYDDESGLIRVVDSADAGSPTGRQIGLPLPGLNPIGTIEGIRLFDFQREDLAKFENVLSWLKQESPQWYEYVMSQRPIDLFYTPELNERGIYGSTACCWTSAASKDIGHIELQAHPPAVIADDMWFVVAFVHESTHVRDYRAKTFELIKDPQILCRDRERSAVVVQRAFLADLLKTSLDVKTRAAGEAALKETDRILGLGTFDWMSACR